MVRNGLVVSLNSPDEDGEIRLIKTLFACNVDPLELEAGLFVLSDHLNDLKDAPSAFARAIEGCEALFDVGPEALIMSHLREILGEVASHQPCEEDEIPRGETTGVWRAC